MKHNCKHWNNKNLLPFKCGCKGGQGNIQRLADRFNFRCLFISGLLQIEYRQEPKNRSKIAAIKTVAAASGSMLLSMIDVSDNGTFYNVSVPLTLLKMESYEKLLGALNASFHRKYSI
jgi:hypothetical protein